MSLLTNLKSILLSFDCTVDIVNTNNVTKKHKVQEQNTACGPVLVFPVVPNPLKQTYIESMVDFVAKHIVEDNGGYFTLKQAKEAYVASKSFNGKVLPSKNDLQKLLKCVCIEKKRVGKMTERNVFTGYKIVSF